VQHQHCSVAAPLADLFCRLSACALLSSHEWGPLALVDDEFAGDSLTLSSV
jgi:hypothetical protein